MTGNIHVVLWSKSLTQQADITEWLEEFGLTVTNVSSREALDKLLDQKSVEVIVAEESQLESPFRFLGEMKKTSPATRIMVIGEELSPERALTWVNYGGAAYYSLPLKKEAFLSKVQSLKAGLESQSFLVETHQNLSELLRKEQQNLKEEAERDDLTGLLDKKYYTLKSKELINECQTNNQSLSLIIFDIDHFKTYNDTHGHPAGDEALKTVANIIQREVRGDDIVGRIGGEEFAVIIPRADAHTGYKIAERVRKSIRNHRFPGEQDLPGQTMTVSLGLATFPDHGDEFDSLIEIADRAMYQAKRQGRDQIARTELKSFRFDPPDGKSYESVSVVGNFNGWRPGTDELERQSNGQWEGTVPVPEGPVEYAFSINGERIVPDATEDKTVEGPGGEPVSKVTV